MEATTAEMTFLPLEATGIGLRTAVKVTNKSMIYNIFQMINNLKIAPPQYVIMNYSHEKKCNNLGPFSLYLVPPPRCSGIPRTDWSCCTSSEPCDVGGGDCDRDSDCVGDLTCGNDNCKADFSSTGSNWASSADCCEGKERSNYGNIRMVVVINRSYNQHFEISFL